MLIGMIQIITPENLSVLRPLIENYLKHIGDSDFFELPLEQQLKWYSEGITEGTLLILASYDQSGNSNGFLVYNMNQHRSPIIFANGDFKVEKTLFDNLFRRFSNTVPYLLFDSGYPIPWISRELSNYLVSSGFTEYPREYMRLEQLREVHQIRLRDEFEFVQCSESLLELVSRMVLRCVEGTDDQAIFPFVYGTYESILKFHTRLFKGSFGTHKESYSWVLMNGEKPVGSSFMITDGGDTGHVMHLAIDPNYRRQGLGRLLLVHSIKNLYNVEDALKYVDLAVTERNPAMHLYKSLGFKRVNDMSSYVWSARK